MSRNRECSVAAGDIVIWHDSTDPFVYGLLV